MGYLRLNVVFIFLTFRRHLDGVTLANDAYVAFQVALGPSSNIIRVRQQSPFVEKLAVCGQSRMFITSAYNINVAID